jgi:hypothetical protein
MNKYTFLIVLLSASSLWINGQWQTAPDEMYLEENAEDWAAGTENETDFSLLLEDREYWLQHPLNLNTATADQLAQLYILNDFQIAAILENRKRGCFLSIYELLYIPGMRDKDVILLKPFVVCEPPPENKESIKSLRNSIDHQILLRYQRVTEQQEGYLPPPDSEPGKPHYLGSPDKLYLRYRLDAKDVLKAGILMEKDQGEEFFTGSNRYGFDFYSAFLSFSPAKSFLRQLIIGDYHVRLGQGLILWSSGAFGKSAGLNNLVRSGLVMKGNLSTDENCFFRGAAVTVGRGDLFLTCFVSSKHIDASPADDTLQADAFSTIATSGLHNTPAELVKEDYLKEQAAGVSLRYNRNRLNLGINGFCQRYDKYCTGQDRLYENFYFAGKDYCAASFDYRYLAKRMQLFGEAAFSYQSVALLNGALFYLHPGVSLALLHRYYDKSYYSSWSDAFREGTKVNNEEGYYAGIETVFGNNRWSFYADIFSFPWLRYRVNVPSQGYEISSAWDSNIGPLQFFFRYKREEKPVNRDTGDQVYEIVSHLREQYKLRIRWPLYGKLSLQGRFELTKSAIQGDTNRYGYLICGDIQYAPGNGHFRLSGRAAWFHAGDFDARLYTWEGDILYASGTQMFYGEGWRFMILGRYDINKRISIWCKLSRTWFPGEDKIGSGLNTIAGDHRSEVKLQVIINLEK